jgi:hypothetical protein
MVLPVAGCRAPEAGAKSHLPSCKIALFYAPLCSTGHLLWKAAIYNMSCGLGLKNQDRNWDPFRKPDSLEQ